jgi:S-adenosylmethionine hydrolase
MIFTLTDFGTTGPYLGQLRAVLRRACPTIDTIDLLSDAPAFEPQLAAYLVDALKGVLDHGDVLLGIVDPGVGSHREPIALEADGRWYVGPDNGIFELVRRRAERVKGHKIVWRPEVLSASFHGRDLFAPVAAELARGSINQLAPYELTTFADWPEDLSAVIYVDGYGNAMTGLRAAAFAPDTRLAVAGRSLMRARTFADLQPGAPFVYENSLGLLEIAANGTSAAALLGLVPGSAVELRA